jgi:hypothetical protein
MSLPRLILANPISIVHGSRESNVEHVVVVVVVAAVLVAVGKTAVFCRIASSTVYCEMYCRHHPCNNGGSSGERYNLLHFHHQHHQYYRVRGLYHYEETMVNLQNVFVAVFVL